MNCLCGILEVMLWIAIIGMVCAAICVVAVLFEVGVAHVRMMFRRPGREPRGEILGPTVSWFDTLHGECEAAQAESRELDFHQFVPLLAESSKYQGIERRYQQARVIPAQASSLRGEELPPSNVARLPTRRRLDANVLAQSGAIDPPSPRARQRAAPRIRHAGAPAAGAG
jgi:hypothetical protein